MHNTSACNVAVQSQNILWCIVSDAPSSSFNRYIFKLAIGVTLLSQHQILGFRCANCTCIVSRCPVSQWFTCMVGTCVLSMGPTISFLHFCYLLITTDRWTADIVAERSLSIYTDLVNQSLYLNSNNLQHYTATLV